MPEGRGGSPTLERERHLWAAGHRLVAGLDEVGRGAWAGPLTVGVAVVSPEAEARQRPAWLRDSKTLAEARREEVFVEVAAWCDAWATGEASPAECDRFGMTAALRLAALRALARLRRRTDAVLVDGPFDFVIDRRGAATSAEGAATHPRRPPWTAVEAEYDAAVGSLRRRPPKVVVPVVDGDATCAAVAAASVLAKVTRDRHMRREAEHFPPYDFERNKGYPSATHKAALLGYGLTAIHRRSWAFTDQLVFR